MKVRRAAATLCALILSLGCGGKEAAPEARLPAPAQAAAPAGTSESADILAREPVTQRAEVLHVLVGWKELEPAYGGRMDERGKARTKAEADALAADVLSRARAGEDFRSLMKTYSEDWGSANSGTSYPVSPEAQLVPPFKALSLRLEAGETGLVRTAYGWHVIQRIE
jgi:hypothetical protein